MDNAAVERSRAGRDVMIGDGQVRAGVRAMAAAFAPYIGDVDGLDVARNAAQAILSLAYTGDHRPVVDVVGELVAGRVRNYPRGNLARLEPGRRTLAVTQAALAWAAAVRQAGGTFAAAPWVAR
jgi:hypothetical protein